MTKKRTDLRFKDLPKEIQELVKKENKRQLDVEIEPKDYVQSLFNFSASVDGNSFWFKIVDGDFTPFHYKYTPLNIVVKDHEEITSDSIVNAIVDKFKSRSEVGIKKYKTTLDRSDLSIEQWLDHAIEENMDMLLYMYKLKSEITKKVNNEDKVIKKNS